jgi:hypothetical protein
MRRADRERLPWLVVGMVAGGGIAFFVFEGPTVRVVGMLMGIVVGIAVGWLGHALIQSKGSSR